MYYFAYGSNMLLARIRQPDRVPDARAVATALLSGHILKFHKRGSDGSAKCDAFATGDLRDVVHGVVFEVEASGRNALDRVEGLGRGYSEKKVHVTSPDGSWSVYFYVAEASHIDGSLKPYAWYKEIVLAGAMQNSLPRDYIRRIDEVEAVNDPDLRRAARQRGLLEECW